MKILWLLGLWAFSAQAEMLPEQAAVVHDRAPVHVSADPHSRVYGRLRRGTPVEVVGESADGRMVEILVTGSSTGQKVRGFVAASDLNLSGAEREELRRLSAGFGFSGSSSGGQTQVQVSTELRYLWTSWLESRGGFSFNFGSGFFVGLRLAQRFYAPVSERFRPFVEGGYDIGNLADPKTSALLAGGGFQVSYGATSYFEVQVNYLYPKPFNSALPGRVTFGGSSGVRF